MMFSTWDAVVFRPAVSVSKAGRVRGYVSTCRLPERIRPSRPCSVFEAFLFSALRYELFYIFSDIVMH